jgi:hypothetical protein
VKKMKGQGREEEETEYTGGGQAAIKDDAAARPQQDRQAPADAGRGRFGGAMADDLAENVVGPRPVLGIRGMFFVPGLFDELAEGVIVFRLPDENEKLVLFL